MADGVKSSEVSEPRPPAATTTRPRSSRDHPTVIDLREERHDWPDADYAVEWQLPKPAK